MRNFIFVGLILILCISISTSNEEVSLESDQSEREVVENDFEKEIDNLYSDLLKAEESISKSLRKLQLLQKIRKDKSSFESFQISSKASLNTLENSEKGEAHHHKNQYSMENMFEMNKPKTEVAGTNGFIEKNIFKAENSSFIKFDYLKTPPHVDQQKDFTTKVLLTLLENGSLAIYSLNSGAIMSQFQWTDILNTNEDAQVPTPIDWKNDIEGFIPDSYDSEMSVTISEFNGNIYIIDFSLQSVRNLINRFIDPSPS